MKKVSAGACCKILLVGHHPVVRQSLREIIEQEPDLEVAAEARDLQEALVAARTLQPDIVVMEVSLARENGVAALRQTCPPQPCLRIIMVGISADREHVTYALKSGACGYLRTEDAAEELIPALRMACSERPFLGAAIRREEIKVELACARAKLKVLIVEDDPDFVEIVRSMLESANYEVLVAYNKEDGIQAVRSERPDAVILDVMMPTGTEGFHFVWELRQHEDLAVRDTPILVLTSIHEHSSLRFYPEQSDSAYAPYEYLPVQDFADKPLAPQQLLEKVSRLLAGRVAQRK